MEQVRFASSVGPSNEDDFPEGIMERAGKQVWEWERCLTPSAGRESEGGRDEDSETSRNT